MPSDRDDKPLTAFLEKEAANEFPPGWIVPTQPKRKEELRLWTAWKAGGEKPEDMQPLLTSLRPLISRQVKKFEGTPIRPEALRAEANNKTIEALRKYDPTQAQMHTHIENQVRLGRFVQHNQNVSRVVGDIARHIGSYQRSHADLHDRLGREPTTQELADDMSIPVRTVERIAQENRRDYLSSAAQVDPFIEETPRIREVLNLIYPYNLTAAEQAVFEYLTGKGGKTKVTDTNKIAKKLGWSDSKVSTTKNAIAAKIKQYL